MFRILTFVLFVISPEAYFMIQAMKTVSLMIWDLAHWDPALAYVPRRLRTKWDYMTKMLYLKSWLKPT